MTDQKTNSSEQEELERIQLIRSLPLYKRLTGEEHDELRKEKQRILGGGFLGGAVLVLLIVILFPIVVDIERAEDNASFLNLCLFCVLKWIVIGVGVAIVWLMWKKWFEPYL